MDKVIIQGFTVDATIGVFDWEKEILQPLVFDIELQQDNKKAASSDNILDAVDYKKITDRLASFVETSNFDLIETMAEQVADILLGEFYVDWIKLTLKKPDAIAKASYVGVVIERKANESLVARDIKR